MSINVDIANEQARFQDENGETYWVCFDSHKMPGKYTSVKEAQTVIGVHASMTRMNWSSLSRCHTTKMTSMVSDGKEVVILDLSMNVDGVSTVLQRTVYTINVPTLE